MVKEHFAKRQNEQDSDLLVQDIPCEECVLGAILQDNSVFDEYREQLSSGCFYKPQHEEIFNAIFTIRERGDVADIITTFAELQKHGTEITPYEITNISSKGVILDLPVYISRLNDLSVSRRIWHIAKKLESIGTSEHNDVESVIEEARTALNGIYSSERQKPITLKEGLEHLYEIVHSNYSNGGNKRGTRTGFSYLDEKGGLQPSDLIIVAADTSVGKTSFVNSIILQAISNSKKVAFYSLEMRSVQLSARFAAMLSGVSSFDILNNALHKEKLFALDKGLGRCESFQENLFMFDENMSRPESVLASIRSMKYKYNIDGVVVDYLQIFSVDSKAANEEKNMADIARRLKNIAKELDIWVIALSQLSRDKQTDEPNMMRIRSSGQIAEAADLVMLIHRPTNGKAFPQPFAQYDTKGKAIITISKGRNVGTGSFICGFNAETTHFYQLDEMELVKKSDNNEMPW